MSQANDDRLIIGFLSEGLLLLFSHLLLNLRSPRDCGSCRRRHFFFGVRIMLGTILGRFSIIYFRGLGLRIKVMVWVMVRARVWVRVGVGVRVSVVLWSW